MEMHLFLHWMYNNTYKQKNIEIVIEKLKPIPIKLGDDKMLLIIIAAVTLIITGIAGCLGKIKVNNSKDFIAMQS